MIWLLRFWKQIAGVLVLALAITFIYRHGYANGMTTERNRWLPQLIAAQKAYNEAEGRRKAIEASSEAVQADLEKHLEQITRDATAALAGSGKRNAGLLRQLTAATRRCDVPPVAGSTASDAGAPAGEGRTDEVGVGLAGITADCRHDAELLGLWQEFWQRESALRR
jgi:hypothetical protein